MQQAEEETGPSGKRQRRSSNAGSDAPMYDTPVSLPSLRPDNPPAAVSKGGGKKFQKGHRFPTQTPQEYAERGRMAGVRQVVKSRTAWTKTTKKARSIKDKKGVRHIIPARKSRQVPMRIGKKARRAIATLTKNRSDAIRAAYIAANAAAACGRVTVTGKDVQVGIASIRG